MTWVLVLLGGAVGAVARSEVTRRATGPDAARRTTAVVNVVGALLLGVLVGAGGGQPASIEVLGTGVLGGFTTFSTWMVQVGSSQRRGATLAIPLVAPLVLGLVAVAVGLAIGLGIGPGH